jgi:hypothetical protein
MKKSNPAEPSSPNSDSINRLKPEPAEFSDVEVRLPAPVSANLPKVEMPKVEKSQTKSGGWFAKPPVRKDYIPPAPTSYPMKVPKDFHQTWTIDTANGEGVVYTIEVTHADINEARTYVVHPDVVEEAKRQCSQGDYTFSILTDKNDGIGGEIRPVELHPWVTKTGQFGLMPLKRPIAGNSLSQVAYDNKASRLAENQGKWVRRTTIEKDLVTIPLPPGADSFGEPRWPKVLTDGDWETIISRAFENRWIKSLEDKVARSLAGLE